MEPGRSIGIWRVGLMIAAAAGIVALVVELIVSSQPPAGAGDQAFRPRDVRVAVRVDSAGAIVIDADSLLHKQLDERVLELQIVRFPQLTVSGAIVARVRPGDEPIEDRWQFSDSHLASTYADWLRTKGEVEFARSQLAKTQELTAAENDYLEANLRRLEPLWKSGNLPERDYKAARAEKLKTQLQGEKDVFSAESALRGALKAMTALERDLSREGVEPVIFSNPAEHSVVVSASVPETKISQVARGQGGAVRFYAYPDRSFEGRVELLSSLLSHERRTLRVLFLLIEPEGLLRPGMFADTSLGTDARQALLVPAEALIHVGQADYVLAKIESGWWKPVPVRVGEQFEGRYEVLEGLQAGQTIISRGAILLKPAVAQVIREQTSAARATAADSNHDK